MNRAEFNSVYDRLPDALLLVGRDGDVVAMNRRAADLLTSSNDGVKLADLVVEPHETVSAYLRSWTGTTQYTPRRLTFRTAANGAIEVRCDGARATSGPEASVMIRLTVRPESQSRFLALNNKIEQLAREVAERRRAEALLAGQNQALSLMTSDAPLSQVLTVLLRAVEEYSADSVIGSILLLDRDGMHLRHGAAPGLPEEYRRAIDGVAIGPSVGSCGTAAFLGRPVVVSDIDTDPLWANFRDLALKHGLRACWSTPIRGAGGEVLGTFAMYYREPRTPGESARHLIDWVTRTAAVAIERSRSSETFSAILQQQTAMLDGLPAGIALVAPDGVIRSVNRTWHEWQREHSLEAFSAGENFAAAAAAYLEPEPGCEFASIEEAINSVRSGAHGSSCFECHLRNTVNDRWFRVSISAVPHGRRPPFDVVAMLVDITDRRAAAEALTRQASALAQMNAELQQFAYVASHDLREPLRTVKSFAQLFVKRYRGTLGEEAEEYLRFISEGVSRMEALLNDLLLYSRVEHARGSHNTAVDMARAAQDALRNLHATIEESGAQIAVGELPTVMGQSVQLTQVLQNLIENAIKYRGPARPAIRISAERINQGWRFAVTDNGIGVPALYRDRIFELFQRLRRDLPGTGIGLALCKKIVEQHGGSIWVEPAAGGGSTFFFTLADAGLA